MIALFFDAESVVHGTLMVITFLPLGASDFGAARLQGLWKRDSSPLGTRYHGTRS